MITPLLVLLALAMFAPGAGSPPVPPPSPATVSPIALTVPSDRRILVMLSLPPEHYRPGSDYISDSYDAGSVVAQAQHRLARRIAHEQGLVLGESWPMPMLGVECVVMIAPDDEPLKAIIERLSRHPGVSWSQPMNEFMSQSASVPSDRLYAAQPAVVEWGLAELHRMATGRGVRIAIIDSMIDSSHPDLRGQVATRRDFVGDGESAAELHGTAVAGIIGAKAGNGLGIAGVAPGARLLGLRACRQRSTVVTSCDSLSIAKALVFAIENHANVVNLSLSGPSDLLIARLVEAGLRRGIEVIAAVDPRTGSGFPASLPGVVAVAQDGLAPGQRGVYNAPGRDVPTTEPGGRWSLVSGNSYAAAHVSGLLALARELSAGIGRPALVASRPDGGKIDACRTLLRVARRDSARCIVAH